VTADTLPRTITPAARLNQVNRELHEIRVAVGSGVHGWAEELQDSRRGLLVEKAGLLGELGRAGERLALLRELALGA
jgi:hypothetical protein